MDKAAMAMTAISSTLRSRAAKIKTHVVEAEKPNDLGVVTDRLTAVVGITAVALLEAVADVLQAAAEKE